jgi:hypothetical protein
MGQKSPVLVDIRIQQRLVGRIVPSAVRQTTNGRLGITITIKNEKNER